MKTPRRLAILIATAILGFIWTDTSVSQAGLSTVCTGRAEMMELTPGWSIEPTTGTIMTVVNGTEECNGPIEGYQPTGIIRTRHSIAYGYVDPDTCSAQEVKGFADHLIPTADGILVLRNPFTATFNPLSDPPGTSGTFEGERFSGRFWYRPIEGDCVKSPLTRIEAGWVGTWHGKGGK